MTNLEERHKTKFLRIIENELNKFEKPIILEFGVSQKALSTSIFLKKCEEKNGFLYSIDMIDYSHHFNSKNWKFIHSKDDNYDFIEKNIPDKFDIIYLDTIHTAKHVEKILYYYYEKLNVGGVFVVDDTSMLYVAGTKIDWKVQVFGQEFTIENPNAQSGCGCGVSFGV